MVKLKDLEFSAFATCRGCGAGLARVDPTSDWICSQVLLGRTEKGQVHSHVASNAGAAVISEREDRSGGSSTRPGLRPAKQPEKEGD